LFEKKKDTTATKLIRMIKGRIIRSKGIPEDLRAESSLNSPIFPNVIRDARRIPSGRAVGTKVREKW
jgi:antitoxin component of RelBE/YafQ-DinJ toxin-antitoxin module